MKPATYLLIATALLLGAGATLGASVQRLPFTGGHKEPGVLYVNLPSDAAEVVVVVKSSDGTEYTTPPIPVMFGDVVLAKVGGVR